MELISLFTVLVHSWLCDSLSPSPSIHCYLVPVLSLCLCTAVHRTGTSLAVAGLGNLFGFCVATCTSKFPMTKGSQPFEQKPGYDTNEATWAHVN